MKRIRYLIPFILFFTFDAAAQPGVLNATIDKQKIWIGEQVQLTLTTQVPTGTPVQWLSIDTLPHFEILNTSKIDSQVAGNNLQLTQRLTLTSWDSGQWLIPSFSLPQSASRTKPLRISVTYSPMDPQQDYHDVKEIIEVQKPAKVTWYWYLIGAALLLLLFILLFPRRKKEKNDGISGKDAYKQALAQLEKLKKEQGQDAKAFYTELITVFRTYVHHRKGIQSFQKTTDDLSIQLKSINLSPDSYNDLVQVLRLSDAVKFARFTPSGAENEAALETIRKSIMAIEQAS